MDAREYHGLIRSTMTELVDVFVSPKSMDETLSRVTTAAVDLIDGVDFADILLITNGEYQSVAPTRPLAPELDTAQQRLAEGPCIDAATTEEAVRCDDLESDSRWPLFGPVAVSAGVRSMLSYHLFNHRKGTGALNLFGSSTDIFDKESEAVGAMLATHASLALLSANRQSQFESALASRDVIGQAKGMIMERFNVDAVRAFELLTSLSQSTNTPVAAVARDIVKSGSDSVSKLRPR